MEKNFADDQIFNQELGDSIKDEFLALYKRMDFLLFPGRGLGKFVALIFRLHNPRPGNVIEQQLVKGSSHFEEFLKVLCDEGVTIKIEVAVEAFRNLLISNLRRKFNMMWEAQSMAENISLLDYLKKKYAKRTKPQWRPFGKSPLEQTLPFRIRMLEKKSAYLNKQLAFQKDQLENVVVRVEEGRKYIESLQQRRSRQSFNMDVRLKDFTKIRDQLVDLQLRSLEMKYH